MEKRLYGFFVKDYELTFYESHVEKKYDVFGVIDFYHDYDRVEIKGKKLICYSKRGTKEVKTKHAVNNENIQYLSNIYDHINNVIAKKETDDKIAYSKENKIEQYKFTDKKNQTITCYDNYALFIDAKGVEHEIFYKDVTGFYDLPPAGPMSGDLMIFVKNIDYIPELKYKNQDKNTLRVICEYICEQAGKLKSGAFVPYGQKVPEPPKESYDPPKPSIKVEPTINTASSVSYNETLKSKEQSYVATADILKLKELYDQGIITEEEFTQKKRQLLGI